MGMTLAERTPTPTVTVDTEAGAGTDAGLGGEHDLGDNAFRAAQLPVGTASADAPPGDDAPGGPLAALVRQWSPLLGDVLDNGLVATLGPDVGVAFERAATELLGGISLLPTVEASLGGVAMNAGTLLGVATGDQRCCETLQAWTGAMTSLGSDWLLPVHDYGGVTEQVRRFGDPVSNLAALVGGGAGLIDTILPDIPAIHAIESALATVRKLDDGAADWVCAQLGLGSAEGGLFTVLDPVWDAVVGQVTAGVDAVFDGLLQTLFAFPGLEEVYRVVDAGTDIVDAMSWLSANWGDPALLEKSPEALADNIASGVIQGGLAAWRGLEGVIGGLKTGASELMARLAAAADVALGVPLLASVGRWLTEAHDALGWLLDSPLWGDLLHAASQLVAFGMDVLRAVADLALGTVMAAGNPVALLGLVTSGAFSLLPACYRAVFLDAWLTLGVRLLGSVLEPVIASLGPLGEDLGAAIQAGVGGALTAVRGRSDEDKATVLTGAVKMLTGGQVAGFLTGLLAGALDGMVDGVVGVFQGIAGIAAMAEALVFAPFRAMFTAIELTVGAIDAVGDAAFEQGDEEDEASDPSQGAAALQEAFEAIGDGALGLLADPALRDPEQLAAAVEWIWQAALDAFAAVGGAMANAVMDLLVGCADFGFDLGRMVGSGLIGVGLTSIGVGALGTIGKLVPALTTFTEGLALFLSGDVTNAAFAQPIRAVLGAIEPLLERMRIPAVDRLLEALRKLLRSVGLLDEAADVDVPKLNPTGRASKALVAAAEQLGDDDVRKAVAEAVERVERVRGDLPAVLVDDVREAVTEQLEAIRGGASVELPEDSVAALRAWLSAQAERLLSGEGEEGEEEEEEEEAEERPLTPEAIADGLRLADPVRAGRIQTARRLGAADLAEAAEQALLQVEVPVALDYEDARALAVGVAAEAHDDLLRALLTGVEPVSPDLTAVEDVMARLVARTAGALPRVLVQD